jgi:predicted O-methyltransferase YrrM
MNLAKHVHEVTTWPYYRTRPIEALRYTYSKMIYARGRVEEPNQFLEALGIPVSQALEGFDQWRPLLERVIETVRRKQGHQGGVSLEDGIILYGIVRALKPQVVIETGVAAGVSNSFINAALIENQSGKLFSIELPPDQSGSGVHADGGVFAWPDSGVGWAVPSEIRLAIADRNELILEDVRTALPTLLSRVPSIDIFFHDDLHTPDHMLWEYETVWPHLRQGGVLLSDDSDFGWIRFCNRHGLRQDAALNLQRLTAVRKAKE